ncbi:hypothetical protein CDPG_00066, partial [Cellulophaga phage phi47:1]
KKLAQMTEQMAVRLEDSVKRAEDVANAAIENEVDRYSENRNRGERNKIINHRLYQIIY